MSLRANTQSRVLSTETIDENSKKSFGGRLHYYHYQDSALIKYRSGFSLYTDWDQNVIHRQSGNTLSGYESEFNHFLDSYGMRGRYFADFNKYFMGNTFLYLDHSYNAEIVYLHHFKDKFSRLSDVSKNYEIGGGDDTKLHLTAFGSIGVGNGRVYYVHRAYQAYQLLHALTEAGYLTQSATSRSVEIVADKLVHQSRIRSYDHRERLKRDICAIDSLLSGEGIVTDRPMGYFAILADILEDSYPTRRRGAQGIALVSLKMDGSSDFDHSYSNGYSNGNLIADDTVKTQRNENAVSMATFGQLTYEYHLPIGIDWQLDFAATAFSGFMYSMEGVDSVGFRDSVPYTFNRVEVLSHTIAFNMFAGYYPNTRTEIRSFAQLKYTYGHLTNSPHIEYLTVTQNHFYDATFINEVHYYVTPQLSIKGGVTLGYSYIHHYSDATKKLHAYLQSDSEQMEHIGDRNDFLGSREVAVEYDDDDDFGVPYKYSHSFDLRYQIEMVYQLF